MTNLRVLFIAFSILVTAGLTARAQDFTLDQGSLSFSANAGTSPAPQQIFLTNQTANAIHISLIPNNASFGIGLMISPNPVAGGGGQATITVTLTSANLEPDTYNGSFLVSDGTTKIKVTISLQVSGVTISAQGSYSLTLVQGKSGSVNVQVTGGPATIAISSNVGWLTPAANAEVPGSFSVGVNSSGLPIGPGNSGLLKLQCQGGSPCVPVAVAIIVDVTPSVFLQANVANLTFQAYEGRMSPPPQEFQVSTNNGTSLAFSLASNEPWLNVSASAGTAASKASIVTATVTESLLKSGPNAATITLQPSNGGPPVVVPVTATLSPFSISSMPPSPIPVSVASGQTQNVPVQVATADGGMAAIGLTAATTDKGTWLSVPASFEAPGTFNVTINASGLAQQNYTGSVVLSCTDATCAPLTITINLTVGAPLAQITAVVGAGLSVPPVKSVSQNALFTIFGNHLAAPNTSRNVVGSDLMNGALPTNLANTCVQGGKAMWGLIYVSDTQINAVADPLTLSGDVPVSVITNCGQSSATPTAAVSVTVAAETPQFLFFKQDPSGKNEVVAVEMSGADVGPSGLIPGVKFTPAKAGDSLTVYGVSWGPTIPAAVVGSLATNASILKFHYTLTIGGVEAKVSYAGLSPDSAALYQINFVVPTGLAAGNQPIVLTIDGVSTPAGAYLAVQ